jgi:hypothetical protein
MPLNIMTRKQKINWLFQNIVNDILFVSGFWPDEWKMEFRTKLVYWLYKFYIPNENETIEEEKKEIKNETSTT